MAVKIDWRFEDHHEFCRYPNTGKFHYCYHATGHCDQCERLRTRDHCPLVPITHKSRSYGHEHEGKYIVYDMYPHEDNIHAKVEWNADENQYVLQSYGVWRRMFDADGISEYLLLRDYEDIDFLDAAKFISEQEFQSAINNTTFADLKLLNVPLSKYHYSDADITEINKGIGEGIN